jgi:hypothetical protein
MENQLEFLQNWYTSNCDGDWEHNYGIKIETIDNPGWNITIDLDETEFQHLVFDEKVEQDDANWYYISIKEGKLNAVGDPNKLIFLIEKVKTILNA